ncbi:MAG: VWA domain-containing protein, partial [Bacteroidia bacterium]|nr:VWA domain-containing protein [Bacteroidia bacterium]
MNFKTGITALFLCFSLSAFSQGTMKVTIKVTDGTVKTIPGVEVKLTESSINKTLKQVTDASGITVFTLTEGLSWSISVGGIKEQSTIERSEERSGSRTMTISYDPAYSARISKQTETRTGYSSIPQNYNSLPPLKPGFGLISVEVKTLAKQNVSGVTVGMTCVSQKTIYTATTNSQGIANFQIPVNQNYDIDVEGLLNLSYIDLTARNEKLIQTATVTYDVPKIPQTIDGDTITQNLKGFSKAFSGMAWYVVKVNADRSTPAVKEIVYAQEINGTRFYKATTDAMGKCAFLLPTGHKYMIHFRFQHDVDVIDASNTAGFINGSMEVTYVPNPRLQNPGQFIPGAENLFLIEFENFIKKQFPKPRNKPFDVFLKWGNPKVNKDAKEALLEVMFTADENYDAKNSPPFNICFVIDQSGSMAGYNRIEKVKESLKKYIQQLRSADIISIVVFEDEMKLVIPPKAVGNNKASITEIIEA